MFQLCFTIFFLLFAGCLLSRAAKNKKNVFVHRLLSKKCHFRLVTSLSFNGPKNLITNWQKITNIRRKKSARRLKKPISVTFMSFNVDSNKLVGYIYIKYNICFQWRYMLIVSNSTSTLTHLDNENKNSIDRKCEERKKNKYKIKWWRRKQTTRKEKQFINKRKTKIAVEST